MEKDLPIEKIIKLRKEKLNFLREEGVNPYPARFEATHNIPGIIKQFSALNSGETSEKVIKTCGRLILRREMGKAIFANIRDSSGTLQIYLRMNSVGEKSFETFLKNIDIGDFVGIEGVPFRTKTGELTVAVNSWTFLSKALRPLPEKWHGVKDIETIYRQRYLDLITNEESRNIFILRSNIISFIRNFLDGKGFLEVETPVMQTLPGGALARPFKTTHKTYDLELYLRIAPELSLKKIIVGGMDKIYEIGKSFRNEGVDRHHNPEFTMLEVYCAYSDCNDMLNLCREMLTKLTSTLSGINEETRQKFLSVRKVTLSELSKETLNGLDIVEAVIEGKIKKAAQELKIKLEEGEPDKKIFDHIFDSLIQPKLQSLTFVTCYPLAFSPLAKRTEQDERLADRFELFVCGEEIANAYSELNDPEEQNRRFSANIKPSDADKEHVLDTEFIEAIEYGMPPCGGLGIGIDRLTMVLTGVRSIRDVILFPLLRPEDK